MCCGSWPEEQWQSAVTEEEEEEKETRSRHAARKGRQGCGGGRSYWQWQFQRTPKPGKESGIQGRVMPEGADEVLKPAV